VLWDDLAQRAILPEELAKDERRRFVCETANNPIWPKSRPPELLRPNDFRAVLALASDSTGVLAAERAARELVRRLQPWGPVCNDRIVWYFTSNSFDPVYFGRSIQFAADSVLWTFWEHRIDIDSMFPEIKETNLPLIVQRIVQAYEGWFIASERHLSRFQPEWIEVIKWRNFSDLPNPFEPLIEIWTRGYRLFPEFSQQDPYIRLYSTFLEPKGQKRGRESIY